MLVAPSFVLDARDDNVLYRLIERLFRARSIAETYEVALDGILEGLKCSRASILRSGRDGMLRFVAWRGLSDSYRRAVDGHSPWKGGAADIEPIYVEDISQGALGSLSEVIRTEGIDALAFSP